MSAETTTAMTSMNAFELVGIRMGIDPSDRRRSSPKKICVATRFGLERLLWKLTVCSNLSKSYHCPLGTRVNAHTFVVVTSDYTFQFVVVSSLALVILVNRKVVVSPQPFGRCS
jgi:hypothetical protein